MKAYESMTICCEDCDIKTCQLTISGFDHILSDVLY